MYKIYDKDPKTYVVMGAPHSATSFISKAIHEQGIPMASEYRRKHDRGYFKYYYQDRDFVDINKLILRATPGGRWNTPPTREEIINTTKMDSRIEKTVNKRKEKYDMWGWKDTRTSLTFPKFAPHLEGDVYLICCFRKPDRIVKSYEDANERDPTRIIDRENVDKYNKSIIQNIKEFCDL